MVVCQYTYKETPDFVRFAKEHDVDLIHLHQPIVGINYPDGFDLKYSEEEWTYFNEAHRLADEYKIPMGGFVKKGDEGKVIKLPINQCTAPWKDIVITPSGDIIPCTCGLGSYVIGNINTQSFTEIWNGKKVNELRNAILANDNKFCKRCGRYG
jgi:radical SAM protein with 4Fe4S-binding SPASM domain